MLWSFEALTRLARGAVPTALVAPAAWPRRGVFTEAWPSRVAAAGGVECRLRAEELSADLSFCIAVAGGGRAELARGAPAERVAAGADTGTQGVARFLDRWCDPGSSLHDQVPSVWLEFDHEPMLRRSPVPFLVFRIADHLPDGTTAGPGGDTLATVVRDGLEALIGRVDGGCMDGIARDLAALPANGRLVHVAAMPHRGSESVRLIVSMRRSEIGGFIGRVRWRGASEGLARTLTDLWPGDDTLAVHLDVGNEVDGRIGIEFYLSTPPVDDPRWRRLLDALVRLELCSPTKRDAVAAWPGPEPAEGAAPVGGLLRQLLVKLVVAPDGPFEAKAYLAFKPRLLLLESLARISRPSVADS